ncbi:MAG TPA: hypothetical protein GX691_00475 [Clostridia bacterium]|jgi:hypothetical protein|nr:hypothetical protein [Clostridia bacterium]
MSLLKDRVVTGALIGILADIVKLAVNYLAFLLNYTQVVFWQLAATRFLDRGDLFSPVAFVVGGVADLTVTAALGIVFLLLIEYTGTDYLWIKGAGFGLAVWVVLFGTLLGQSVQAKLPQSSSGILVTLVAHIIFGIGLAFFTRLYYNILEYDNMQN